MKLGETYEPGVAEDRPPGSQGLSTTVRDYREALYQRMADGASGSDVVSAFTEFVDGLLIGRYRNAARELSDSLATVPLQQCCLVALGGYGRRELAPFSDIDIMFLYRKEGSTVVRALSRAFPHGASALVFIVFIVFIAAVQGVQACAHGKGVTCGRANTDDRSCRFPGPAFRKVRQ